MSATMTLDGLRDLVKAMERLPDDLEERAAATVEAAARDAAATLGTELARGETGNLRAGVRVRRLDALVWQTVSAAPHAAINEEGTDPRFTKAGAARGVSPASKTVARVASQRRRQMNRELARDLEHAVRAVR